MSIIKRVFDYKGSPILAAVFITLFIVEGKRQLRKRKQPRWQRAIINSVVAIPGFSLLRLLLLPAMVAMAKKSSERKWGLNHRYSAHPVVKTVVSFLLLDYSNYLWHLLLHRVPVLWRFHVVHHCDPDLDVSTAVRFHFGELIASVFYRSACVFLIGVKPLQVLVYEIVFEGATQFHHSNWKLPYNTEKLLNKVIVTPRMHGIHHSIVEQETNSNYSIILSFWDRLGNTIRLNIHQDEIITGIPAYNDPAELTIGYLLKMPFGKIRKSEHKDEERASIPGRNNLAP
jgi:sterol desaturase/sphingolipid hydroxylase (fatty acid hydroxylase superfamily)